MNLWILLFLIIALWYDLREFRIPNWWIGIGGIITLGQAIYDGKLLMDMLAGFLLPFVLCILLFWFGCLGGGDIKLMMICGIFLGWNTIALLFYSFLWNGLYAVLFLWKQKSFYLRFSKFSRYISSCLISRQIKPYIRQSEQEENAQIHFSVGVFLAYITLFMGGVL